ncbi:hypothetical protein CGZ93_12500 [Enemella dayhoffiae]|uniref:DUF899 domain-containing protein n=1 Tax=Enemella dayhoffiae TaxID=2016507 RepID=A0A255H136_9ACTN|nr:DUF899 family protein [Enemella dayhoffiae]OYO21013.1 hypothetical protein CGZ93_12500 [Enemella dayhoffiae]
MDEPHPDVVEIDRWRESLARLREKEKAHTRAGDALAAERRRLPMHPVADYPLTALDGTSTSLGALFAGRPQLIVYQFMPLHDGEPCSGCSMFLDNVGSLAALAARSVSFAAVSRSPADELAPVVTREGFRLPFFSSAGSSMADDLGEPEDEGTGFALHVFLRSGDTIHRTWATSRRGVEQLGTSWSLLDVAPFGRQEPWEDSPVGWPQSPAYAWWRLPSEWG